MPPPQLIPLPLRRPIPVRGLHTIHPYHQQQHKQTPSLGVAETAIYNKLHSALSPTELKVQDISGGCGSMYGLEIASEKFRGLSIVRQHKLVNEILKEEVSGWHGVTLKTRAPD